MFWDVRRWHGIWSPISTVEVGYDDGKHQEFTMSLQWRGQEVTVRTLRFIGPLGKISFFSPNPPPEMSHHRGKWEFKAAAEGCEIGVSREYALLRENHETDRDYAFRALEFRWSFEARLSRLLQAFQDYYAARATGPAGRRG